MAHKIAIVEDDQPISMMYQLKFDAEGFEVKTAANGKLGLELIKSFDPEVVLLDLMMPELGGAEMLKELRNTDYGKKARVFLFTNIGTEEIPDKLKKFDVSGVILKAYHTPAQVVDKVRAVLK
jgi:two-component system response regulator AdeR